MWFITGGPNEAIVVSGCCHSKPNIIIGGRTFYVPCLQQVEKLSLNTMTIVIETKNVYTSEGVPISVTGVAQMKVQTGDDEMMQRACELFLGMPEHEVAEVAKETLEGHQRAIMGTMTVEEIYQDRQKFSKSVFDTATSDMVQMGLTVVSYTLKDVRDDYGYLIALGQPRIAEVKRDALIGQAAAFRDAGIRESLAEQAQADSEFQNKIEIAKSSRDYELRQADNLKEVNTRKATANLAYELQAAKNKQAIKDEEMEIVLIERKRRIELQKQEAERQEKALDAQIRKPAEAEKYRIEKIADSLQKKAVMEAEAEAESKRLQGEAEAYAIQVKAKAEAEQMQLKAAAWKEYQDAAVVDMMLSVLPQVAHEITAPMNDVGKITIVSSGDGDVGVGKLTDEMLGVMMKLPEMVKNLTGVDIAQVGINAQSV